MPKKKIETQIVICGRGGQGVLFLTRLLDEVALSRGNNVISSETHGMAMRGGSVVSYIKVGNFNSPLIRAEQADVLIALSESEVTLNRHLLKKGSHQIFCNSPDNKPGFIDATAIARDLGSVVVTNLVLLGFACGNPAFPFAFDVVEEVLKQISPSRVLKINQMALAEGNRRSINRDL
jgi:indolepyruvate ferredoxin oxidoreductase beta subunit